MGTLAQVWWLAIGHRVNWKVNIKLGRNEVGKFRDGIASECEEQTGVAKANKNNPLQLDKTSLHIMPVVQSLERAAAVIYFCLPPFKKCAKVEGF